MIIHCLNPSVVDVINMPYKFVWMQKMGYREMYYFAVEAYWLKSCEKDDDC